jgi:hypothetical protein
MLKTWLTWLQPGVSGLGILLLVASPLCSIAAPKPKAFANSKTPSQQPQWSVASIGGSTISTNSTKEVQSSGIAATPDVAVRQLALNSMVTTGKQPTSVATHLRRDSRSAVSGLHSPSIRSQHLSASAAVKMPVAPVVPGIFIGNSDVRMPSQFLPSATKPAPQTVAAGKAIGSPTSLSAMMATTNINAANPFPVVTPELMQKLGTAPTIASARSAGKAVHSLDPIAVMTSGSSHKAPKFIDANAVASAKLQPSTVKSLDPIASIPSGLQRLLGNDLNSESRSTTRSAVKASGSDQAVAKATNAKANLLAAMQPLSALTSTNDVSAPNLQLATAQAYTSVPKFSIPGDKVSSRAISKPAVSITSSSNDQAPASVVQPKTNAMASDRFLGMSLRQSWMTTSQRNNLGGLILGSQSMSTDTRKIGLGATSTVKTSSSGLSAFNPDKFN